MNDWRTDLNRLAVEFHYGVGDLPEAFAWAEVANADTGEVHSLVWDLFATTSPSTAAHLLAEMAWDVNKFRPWSQLALPFAMGSLRKALEQFLARRRSVQSLCEMVSELDTIHVVGSQQDTRSIEVPANGARTSWLGNLWNCCDWCDASCTYENSQPLVDEARRVFEALANLSLQRTASPPAEL